MCTRFYYTSAILNPLFNCGYAKKRLGAPALCRAIISFGYIFKHLDERNTEADSAGQTLNKQGGIMNGQSLPGIGIQAPHACSTAWTVPLAARTMAPALPLNSGGRFSI